MNGITETTVNDFLTLSVSHNLVVVQAPMLGTYRVIQSLTLINRCAG